MLVILNETLEKIDIIKKIDIEILISPVISVVTSLKKINTIKAHIIDILNEKNMNKVRKELSE